MPSAIIEVRRNYTALEEEGFIDAVHAAMVEGRRSEDSRESDRTLRLVVHEPHRFATPPGKSDRYTLVNIDLISGRSLNAKRALYRALVGNLGARGIPEDHVKVLLRESPLEDWSIRGIPASEMELGYKIEV